MSGEAQEVLWRAPGHAVARWGQMVIQIRSGEMTSETLAQIETVARLARAKMAAYKKRGAMLISTAVAPAPSFGVARQQQQLMKGLSEDPNLYVAGVIEGDGLAALAQRTVVGTIFRSDKRGLFGDVVSAAQWLCERVEGVDARQLVTYVRSIRPDDLRGGQ